MALLLVAEDANSSIYGHFLTSSICFIIGCNTCLNILMIFIRVISNW